VKDPAAKPDVLGAIIDQARGERHAAVKDLERELTYDQLIEEVALVASGLSARGVIEGDRVALLIPNSVDFVVAALASLWIGAIFVPLALIDPEHRLVTIVTNCSPKVVITSAGREGVADVLESLAGIPLVAITALKGFEPIGPVDRSQRPVYAIYTSGTTGTPKGVLVGAAAFAAAVRAASNAVGLSRDTRTLCISPFNFDGSYANLFSTLYCGGLCVIPPRDSLLFARTFFHTVANEAITFSGFTPSYLRLLLASPQIATLDGSSLTTIALGGEACPVGDLMALWKSAPNIRVFNRYGPTETTIAVTHIELTPEIIAEGTVPIGTPHPNVTFHLIDETGHVLEGPDQVGELYVGGVQLMERYWADDALTKEVLRTDVVSGETLYRTGDLVFRDEIGQYVYVDRADRVIKRSGVRISLVELGSVLSALDGVISAVCIAYDNEGELGIAAFAVVKQGVLALNLRRAARADLPDTMLPDRIELVKRLPLNKSNKLDEKLLLSGAGLSPVRRGESPPA
jgi:amino acid adenylation domain-containing protein